MAIQFGNDLRPVQNAFGEDTQVLLDELKDVRNKVSKLPSGFTQRTQTLQPAKNIKLKQRQFELFNLLKKKGMSHEDIMNALAPMQQGF